MTSNISTLLWALTATVACLWCPRGAAGPVPARDPGPCIPPTDSSTPTGLRGYRRFHANDSLIGRPVPCTRDDKICFRHNLLFHPEGDRCEPLGGGSIGGCSLRPNRTEFEHGSGRLIGACASYYDPCPGYRMAFDGRCHRTEVVRDTICGCDAKPVWHILFGFECRSPQPPSPKNITQPPEEGRCLIPDLRFPDTERKEYSKANGVLRYPPALACDARQAECFSQGKVRVPGHEGCYKLLERGPCPEGHLVALDVAAAAAGTAAAACVHERGGCPPGSTRMFFDGRCHEDRVLEIAAPGHVHRDQYGENFLSEAPYKFQPGVAVKGKERRCSLSFSAVLPHLNRILAPPCGQNNMGKCDLYDVETSIPAPLDIEDT